MLRRPPGFTRAYTLFPYPTAFRAGPTTARSTASARARRSALGSTRRSRRAGLRLGARSTSAGCSADGHRDHARRTRRRPRRHQGRAGAVVHPDLLGRRPLALPDPPRPHPLERAGEGVVTGGWGTPKAKPPSNDPERPPKGPASVSRAADPAPVINITIINVFPEERPDRKSK